MTQKQEQNPNKVESTKDVEWSCRKHNKKPLHALCSCEEGYCKVDEVRKMVEARKEKQK